MQTLQFRLSSADGASFHCYRWSDGAPRAIVQIVHGAAEHAGRYARFAAALVARGFVVYGDDHRGHGLTAPSPDMLGNMGPPNALERVVDDVATLARHAAGEHPGLPLVVFGHSMGSLITQRLLMRHGAMYRSVVLSGTLSIDMLLQARPQIDAAVAAAGRDVPATDLQTAMFSALMAGFEDPRTPFDWLSRDHAEVDRYIADPCCGFPLTLGSWQDIAAVAALTADAGELRKVPTTLRVLIASGAADPVHLGGAGIEQLHARYAAAGIADLRWRLYPGGRHEMLNETNRDEYTRDVIAWIEESLAARR